MKLSEIPPDGALKIVSREGGVVGELSAIHVVHGTDVAALAQVAIEAEQDQLIIPLLEGASAADEFKVPYDMKRISKGPRVPPGALLTAGETKEILEYYGERGLVIADRHRALGRRGSEVEAESALGIPVRSLPPRVLPIPSHVNEGDF
jgi:hypothetical protein